MKKFVLPTAAAIAFAGTTQAATILDDFAGDPFILSVPVAAAGPYNTSANISGDLNTLDFGANLFGDERTFTLSVNASGGGTAQASMLGNAGVLAVDTGILAQPGDASLEVQYLDYADVDITNGGANSLFAVGVIFIDGEFTFGLALSDDGLSPSPFATVTVDSTGTAAIPLNDPAFAGVDLTSIDRIWFTASNATRAADVAIDNVGFVVPEPTSLALLGLGGLALVRRRR